MTVRRIAVQRYVTPLREGGSLPALVEGNDGSRWVVKFRGAGQGPRVLAAELIAGQLAAHLRLPVPEIAIARLDPGFGRAEPDPEIQDILRASHGDNVALGFLPQALAFDPAVDTIDPEMAADIVWFDAWIANVDRNVRNANLLVSAGRPWMIDHGAALYVHHRWQGWLERRDLAVPTLREHLLLPLAASIEDADARARERLDRALLATAVDAVPGDWLPDDDAFADSDEQRTAYVEWLHSRLTTHRGWLQAAADAQALGAARLAARATHRDWDPA